MRPSMVLFTVAAVAASACGPAVRSASFVEFPPRADDHPIRIFSTRVPECDYEEVGLVRVSEGTGFSISLEDMLDALRERAREMGGDAVIGVGRARTASGAVVAGSVGIIANDGLAGTVVRFTDGGCTT